MGTVCVAHGTQGGHACIRSQSLIALFSFCYFGIHSLSPFSPPPPTHRCCPFWSRSEEYTLQTFELHYNISCQVALNVVCVVHICTIHSLVPYCVLCEVLWMALNVLISECWWLVWGVIHLLKGHILSITACPEVCTGIRALAMVCGSPS